MLSSIVVQNYDYGIKGEIADDILRVHACRKIVKICVSSTTLEGYPPMTRNQAGQK
jgi:hypothetical protein